MQGLQEFRLANLSPFSSGMFTVTIFFLIFARKKRLVSIAYLFNMKQTVSFSGIPGIVCTALPQIRKSRSPLFSFFFHRPYLTCILYTCMWSCTASEAFKVAHFILYYFTKQTNMLERGTCWPKSEPFMLRLSKNGSQRTKVLYRINPPLPGYPTGRCVIVFVWHWIDVGNKDFFSGLDWPDGSDHHSSVRVLTVSWQWIIVDIGRAGMVDFAS